jgi:hypothetical protein
VRRVLVRVPEGKTPLARPGHRWEGDSKVSLEGNRWEVDLSGSGKGQVAGLWECRNEPLGSIKCGDFWST